LAEQALAIKETFDPVQRKYGRRIRSSPLLRMRRATPAPPTIGARARQSYAAAPDLPQNAAPASTVDRRRRACVARVHARTVAGSARDHGLDQARRRAARNPRRPARRRRAVRVSRPRGLPDRPHDPSRPRSSRRCSRVPRADRVISPAESPATDHWTAPQSGAAEGAVNRGRRRLGDRGSLRSR
jgi:hypothetical protein